jgi:hypothetical protein
METRNDIARWALGNDITSGSVTGKTVPGGLPAARPGLGHDHAELLCYARMAQFHEGENRRIAAELLAWKKMARREHRALVMVSAIAGALTVAVIGLVLYLVLHAPSSGVLG